MTKRLVYFVLICFIAFSCEKPQKETKSETIKKIAEFQQASKQINDSSLIYLNSVDKLINQIDLPPDSLFIENTFLKGYYYSKVNQIDSATMYLHEAINLIDSSNARKRDLTYFRYASNFDFDKGKYTNAISKGDTYLEVLNKTNDYYAKVYVYNLFERVYIELKDYEQALLANKKCIEASDMASKSGVLSAIEMQYNSDMLSVSHLSKAKYLYTYFNDVDGSYKLLDSIIADGELNNHSKILLYYERGNLKFRDKLYKYSISDYQETLKYIDSSENPKYYSDEKAKSFINISEAYTRIKNKYLAKKYLDSVSHFVYKKKLNPYYIELAKLRIRLKNINSDNNETILADIDSVDYHSNRIYANRMNEELLALKSSNERERELTKEKQEAEISNLKLKSRNLLLSILAGLTAVIGYIIYRQRKFKFQKQSLQMQQRLLRSQMNPHFMSNTLYAIQNTIKSDQEGSVKYLTKFSRLLRLILENSMQNYVLLEKEMESLKKYMDLQLLRFPDTFKYDIALVDVDEDLVTIPPMLIQPFVENSIEHGFLGVDYKGDIKIKLSYNKKYLNCIIEDNGVGLNNINNSKKQSASSELISDFIFKATKSKISVLDKKNINKNESGTRIEFLIPYKILEHD